MKARSKKAVDPYGSAKSQTLTYTSQTLHVCHILPTLGWFWGVNVGIYGIHGVSGPCDFNCVSL